MKEDRVEVKQWRRESTISSLDTVSLVETWGKQLPKMEEVLIMRLMVRQLVILV